MPIDFAKLDNSIASSDRILVLKPIEGENIKSSTGLVDNRLFKGGNRVHAVRDENSDLWFVRFDAGLPPEPLRQKFTSFSKLFNFAEQYFKKRNINIVEVEE